MDENKEKDKEKPEAWYAEALSLFSRLSIWIAVPVILATFLGKWLDRRYESEPWLLLLCVGISFVFSMGALMREVARIYRK
jgi:F0F1-type ATP synthase assembly protein I